MKLFATHKVAYVPSNNMIERDGYPCEVHFISTDDGYILQLHRIPQRNYIENKTTPVLIQHGLLGSSADFLLLGPNKALAYLLADEGYDVWLLNCRGNIYSRMHKTLDPDTNSSFWNFSFYEIGIYDLPAAIDYILNVTKSKNVFHIGHSQGTTSFYVMCSERPNYNLKVKSHFGYSPVAYMGNIFSPVMKVFSYLLKVTQFLSYIFEFNEFLPHRSILCGNKATLKMVCANIYFLSFGFNDKELNKTLLPTIFNHIPSGASVRQIIHFGQEVISGRFCKYNYLWENFEKYHSVLPPAYNIKKITTPVYLFYSKGDWISSDKDVEKFGSELPNLKKMVLNVDDKWSHDNYLFGISAKERIYDETIAHLNMLD